MITQVDGDAARADGHPVHEKPDDAGLLGRKQSIPEIVEAMQGLDNGSSTVRRPHGTLTSHAPQSLAR
jgi:hypothetical protein